MKNDYRHIHTLRTSVYQYTKILIEILLKFFLDIRDMIGNFISKHYHEGKTKIFAEYRIEISNLKISLDYPNGEDF